MKDLRTLLTAADPLAGEPPLPQEEALAIRRAVIAAARSERPGRDPWLGAVPIAAALIVTIAAGVAIGLKLPPAERQAGAPAGAAERPERRQLQFATPGGTRIIWTLDPDFELQGSTP